MDANKKKTMGLLICLGIAALLFVVIPVNEAFTMQMKLYVIVTVFCIANIALDTLPVLGLALILPALYIVFKLVPVNTAFGSYGGSFMWMALGALYLGKVMDETNFLKRLSYKLIAMMGGTFSGAVWGVFITCTIINMITFGGGWVIALPVIIGIIKAFNLSKGKESALICFAGMCGAADSGCFLYYPANVELYNSLLGNVFPDHAKIGVIDFPIRNWFMLVACVLSIFIFIKLYERSVKKSGVSAIENEGATKEHFMGLLSELGPMSLDEWKSLGLFVIILIGCIGSAILGWDSTIFFLTVPYLALIPKIGCSGDKAIKALKGISFDGLFFSTSCLSIGAVGAAVGFNAWVTSAILPVVEGKSMLFTLMLILLVVFSLNFVLTPGAISTGLGGSLMSVGASVGISPVAVGALMAYSVTAIVMPHEVATFLMMYSMGYWPMKDFVKQEALKAAIMIAGFALIMYPFWNIAGLL